jgi:hypothetical protein
MMKRNRDTVEAEKVEAVTSHYRSFFDQLILIFEKQKASAESAAPSTNGTGQPAAAQR